jgi:threonine aldolase
MDPKAKVFDFRSDTVTAPTDEMFDIMKSASRGDDVFQVRREGYFEEFFGWKMILNQLLGY